VRLRKLAIDGEKTLQGSQNLRTSRAYRCSAFSVWASPWPDRPSLSLVHRRAGVGPPTV